MIRIPSRFAAVLTMIAVLGASGAAIYAHEVTYTGTVIALKTSTYAQPNGGTREVRELEATVADPKTKKPLNKVFTINEKTRVVRAGKPVRLADLTAQKDEKVAVVVDHDVPGDIAITIRFEAAK
jgi:hypothetical protein